MNEDFVKPCPFCGYAPDGLYNRQVHCRCGAVGPVHVVGDEAISWNTRADADHIEALEAENAALKAKLAEASHPTGEKSA